MSAVDRQTPRPASRLAALRDAHWSGFSTSARRLLARPAATLLTAGVIAIALTLPLCLGLAVGELQTFSGTLSESREISVFLDGKTQPEQAQRWAQEVRELTDVAEVNLRTPEDGLQELRSLDALGGTLDVLDYNPLPFVALVLPAAKVDDDALAQHLQSLPGVDFVQHDAQWRKRLGAWLTLGQRFVGVAALLLGLGVLLVVGNTVRLDIQDRSSEIATVRLLGASNGFIRRPFLYLGASYGALAGLLSLLITWALQRALAEPIGLLVSSYAGDYTPAGLSLSNALLLLLLATALGWIGAFAAVNHHLRQSSQAEISG